MPAPSASIVVVSWNTMALLQACLESIPASWPGQKLEVVVVDNGSKDGTQAMVSHRFPSVTLLDTHANLGYAKAVNRGLAYCSAPFVCLLNSDTVMAPGSLGTMVEHLRANPGVGMLGPVLLNLDSTLQDSRHSFPFMQRSLARLMGGDPSTATELATVDWLVGACLVLPEHVIRNCGGLDEDYPFYGEDLDLAYRVHEQGLAVVWLPAAQVHHVAEGSLGPTPNPEMRTRAGYEAPLRFLRKHGNSVDVVYWRLSRGSAAAVRYARAWCLKGGRDAEYQLALWSGVLRLCLSGTPGTWTLESMQ
jgi:GT2 family glycosyltransferase